MEVSSSQRRRKLLLISSDCDVILDRRCSSEIHTLHYDVCNSYERLWQLLHTSIHHQIASMIWMVTCNKGNLQLLTSSDVLTSNYGILTSNTILNNTTYPGKFFLMLFSKLLDENCRLELVAPGCDSHEDIAEKLNQFIRVGLSSKHLEITNQIIIIKTEQPHNDGDIDQLFTQDSTQLLNLFEKIRMVGKGAFGTAVLYRKKDDDSLVVLKEINMTELNSQERLLALNEIKILSMLNHPNIICYFDTFEQNGVLMIEMEYADDGNLSQYLSRQEKGLSEEMIIFMFGQITSGISYMHQQHILHRDLKTANIFKTKQNCLKIGDFGVSKIMTSEFRKANTMIGTPYYISPEICEGRQYDEKSDIWSLGCILYEMATLKRTFEASNLPAVVNKIINVQVSSPISHTNYSNELRKIAKLLLSKNPNLRPTAHELETKYLPEIMCKYDVSKPMTSSTRRAMERSCDTRSVLYLYDLTTMTIQPIDGFPSKIKIRQICTGNNHIIAIGMERIVYTWGDNQYGQLGHGHLSHVSTPYPVKALKGKSIVTADCGRRFSIFISDNGIALSCGENFDGCLGHGDNENNDVTPRLIEGLLSYDVIDVACGDRHVVVLCANGKLFSWGCNDDGQLGIGKNETKQTKPHEILMTQSIRDVRAGPDCTVFITDVGTLLACGRNNHNKLGLNERNGFLKLLNNKRKSSEVENRSIPTAVKSIKDVIDVRIANDHIVALIRPDNVLVLGSNEYGQKGSDKPRDPYLVKEMTSHETLMVECGETYTVAGTSSSTVLIWGNRQLKQQTINERNKPNNLESNLCDDLQQDSSSTINEFLFPTPILNVSQQQASMTSSSSDDVTSDLVVYLEAIVPIGDKILILVETNAPTKKEKRKKVHEKKKIEKKTMEELSSDLTSSSTGDVTSRGTPDWIKEEFAEAIKDDEKSFNKMASDETGIQLNSGKISPKSPPISSSSPVPSKSRSQKMGTGGRKRRGSDVRNKQTTNVRYSKQQQQQRKTPVQLYAEIQRITKEKEESEAKIVLLEEEHQLNLQEIYQRHHQEKEENEEKMRKEIISLREELDDLLIMIAEERETMKKNVKSTTTSRTCEIQ